MFPPGVGDMPQPIFWRLFWPMLLFIPILVFVAIVVKRMIKAEMARKGRSVMPPAEELYEKMLEAYMGIYGAMGKWYLESKINSYTNQGLTQEEAIQKLAKEEGI